MADDASRKGTQYANPDIGAWLDEVHAGFDPALARAFHAPAVEDMPAIQVSQTEGRALQLIAQLVGARRAVEIGTLAGFSAIHLARGMRPDGLLWTVEFNPKHAAVARANLAEAGLASRVTVVEGDGMTVLPGLEAHGPFDLVFIDADKARYDQYARWAREHLRPGGLMLVDNAYLFGKLLADEPRAEAVRRMHREAAAHFDSVCLPTPDGLLLAIRR